MKLVLIFGVWINLQSVDVLRDNHGACYIYGEFNPSDNLAIIKNKSCNEVAAEINKAGGR